jgi:hypothetical protein
MYDKEYRGVFGSPYKLPNIYTKYNSNLSKALTMKNNFNSYFIYNIHNSRYFCFGINF